MDPGEAFREDDIRADTPVEIVVGEALQEHAEAVSKDADMFQGFDADLQMGARTPGKGLVREKEPETEGNEKADCVSHMRGPLNQ
jgi:hypothetical protein